MYNYIKGIVSEIKSTSIVLDNNGIGYEIYTPNPFAFEEGKDYRNDVKKALDNLNNLENQDIDKKPILIG